MFAPAARACMLLVFPNWFRQWLDHGRTDPKLKPSSSEVFKEQCTLFVEPYGVSVISPLWCGESECHASISVVVEMELMPMKPATASAIWKAAAAILDNNK